MGITSARPYPSVSSEDSIESFSTEYCLPVDVLIEILSYVSPKDLIKNCSLVSSDWRDLVNGHALWKIKCIRDEKTIPPIILKVIPQNFYRFIYLYNPFGRNLLRNPSGDAGLRYWTIQENGGNGWIVENPPKGSDEIPKEAGASSCFATSYGNCSKYQLIDLYQEGLTPEILEVCHPVIVFGEWHASRFDCGTSYKMSVELWNQDESVVHRIDTDKITEVQWTGRAWSKVNSKLSDYPSSIRYIVFEHSGQDTQFWAGHYGSKMTGAYVNLSFDFIKKDQGLKKNRFF